MARPRKHPKTPEWTGMPSAEGAKREISSCLQAVQTNLSAIKMEQDSFDDVYKELNVKYGIPKRVFNFLAKAMYEGNQEETFAKNAELKAAWEALHSS